MEAEPLYLKNIRNLRVNAKYTQEAVSARLNIQRQTYCNYENGTRMPPLDIIISLAKLYDVSVDYILSSSGKDDIPANYRHLRASERMLLETMNTLPENSQREVWQFISFKKKYPS